MNCIVRQTNPNYYNMYTQCAKSVLWNLHTNYLYNKHLQRYIMIVKRLHSDFCLFYERKKLLRFIQNVLDQTSYWREFEPIAFYKMCGDNSNRCQIQRFKISEGKLWCIYSKKWRGYGTGTIPIISKLTKIFVRTGC